MNKIDFYNLKKKKKKKVGGGGDIYQVMGDEWWALIGENMKLGGQRNQKN